VKKFYEHVMRIEVAQESSDSMNLKVLH